MLLSNFREEISFPSGGSVGQWIKRLAWTSQVQPVANAFCLFVVYCFGIVVTSGEHSEIAAPLPISWHSADGALHSATRYPSTGTLAIFEMWDCDRNTVYDTTVSNYIEFICLGIGE